MVLALTTLTKQQMMMALALPVETTSPQGNRDILLSGTPINQATASSSYLFTLLVSLNWPSNWTASSNFKTQQNQPLLLSNLAPDFHPPDRAPGTNGQSSTRRPPIDFLSTSAYALSLH